MHPFYQCHLQEKEIRKDRKQARLRSFEFFLIFLHII